MWLCNLRHGDYFSLVYTINYYAWTRVTMLDMDVGHAVTQHDTQQLFAYNHALTCVINISYNPEWVWYLCYYMRLRHSRGWVLITRITYEWMGYNLFISFSLILDCLSQKAFTCIELHTRITIIQYLPDCFFDQPTYWEIMCNGSWTVP